MKDDSISRRVASEAVCKMLSNCFNATDEMIESVKITVGELPPAQPDSVTASLEELINDYGEDGFFIVDGVNYQANELLNELKNNSSVGEKFRKQITKTIVQYFMKFGG